MPDSGAKASGFDPGRLLRDQLRNIAPFATLIVLVGFFSIAAPSFATLGNLENILQQVSITAMIAVGLTFVILTAEIDLSVAAIANATAIVLCFFTAQPDYVNIQNLPLSGLFSIPLALAACAALGLLTAFGVTKIGIPSFIMTLAMMQIGAGLSAVLVRGQIAYSVPPLVLTLGSKSIYGVPWITICAATMLLVAHLVLSQTRFGRYVYRSAQPRGGGIFRRQRTLRHRRGDDDLGGMLGDRRHAGRRLFRLGAAERVRHLPARRDRGGGGRRHQPVWRARRHRQHDCRPVRARRAQQRAGLRQDRQFLEDPHPRPDPAGGAGH